jgi:predicted DNA-binding transcriptional regulator AlpA
MGEHTRVLERTDNSGPELVTTAEAAQMMGVGQRTLWRWSRCGVAPRPLKIGLGRQGAVRYRRRELLAWISDGCPKIDGGAQT